MRRELHALFYGSEAGPQSGEAGLPESLLQWLSARFVHGDDLHASLATLEKSILGNVSLQLEQSKQQPACAETVTQSVTQSVTHTAQAAGMTEEVCVSVCVYIEGVCVSVSVCISEVCVCVCVWGW